MINNIAGNSYPKMQFKTNLQKEEQNRFKELLNQSNDVKLNDEQIKGLQAKYNVNNISDVEFRKLHDKVNTCKREQYSLLWR